MATLIQSLPAPSANGRRVRRPDEERPALPPPVGGREAIVGRAVVGLGIGVVGIGDERAGRDRHGDRHRECGPDQVGGDGDVERDHRRADERTRELAEAPAGVQRDMIDRPRPRSTAAPCTFMPTSHAPFGEPEHEQRDHDRSDTDQVPERQTDHRGSSTTAIVATTRRGRTARSATPTAVATPPIRPPAASSTRPSSEESKSRRSRTWGMRPPSWRTRTPPPRTRGTSPASLRGARKRSERSAPHRPAAPYGAEVLTPEAWTSARVLRPGHCRACARSSGGPCGPRRRSTCRTAAARTGRRPGLSRLTRLSCMGRNTEPTGTVATTSTGSRPSHGPRTVHVVAGGRGRGAWRRRGTSPARARRRSARSVADFPVRVSVCHWLADPRPVSRTSGSASEGTSNGTRAPRTGTAPDRPGGRSAGRRTAAARSGRRLRRRRRVHAGSGPATHRRVRPLHPPWSTWS